MVDNTCAALVLALAVRPLNGQIVATDATDAAAPANLHNRMVICQATRHCVPRVFIIHAHTLIARLCSDFDVDMFITAPHRRIRGGGGGGGVGFVCVCFMLSWG